jgi:polar amino acid transport system substrate-binding protein
VISLRRWTKCAAHRWVPLALLLGILWVSPSWAQGEKVVHAAVAVFPPAVMQSGGHLTGFSIDIWEAIAARIKVKTDIAILPDVPSLAKAMKSRQADILLTPAIYTEERDRDFDFTYPILTAGFEIAVPENEGTAAPNPLHDVLRFIFSPAVLIWLGIAVLLIVVPAHIMWFVDRGTPKSISPAKGYIPGIYHALIWAASALMTQSQQFPARNWARAFALLWMFVGIVFVAFFTAQLTANLTIQQIRGLVNGPDDLPGKRVGTVAGTLAADYLKKIGADVQPYPDTAAMFAGLSAGKVDAVLASAPIVRYFATHDGKGKVKTVGNEFLKRDLAYMVQLDSPFRRQINTALTTMYDDGTYDAIYDKWFGDD